MTLSIHDELRRILDALPEKKATKKISNAEQNKIVKPLPEHRNTRKYHVGQDIRSVKLLSILGLNANNKIVFEVQSFEQIKQVQSEDCYITRAGIKHELRREGDSA